MRGDAGCEILCCYFLNLRYYTLYWSENWSDVWAVIKRLGCWAHGVCSFFYMPCLWCRSFLRDLLVWRQDRLLPSAPDLDRAASFLWILKEQAWEQRILFAYIIRGTFWWPSCSQVTSSATWSCPNMVVYPPSSFIGCVPTGSVPFIRTITRHWFTLDNFFTATPHNCKYSIHLYCPRGVRLELLLTNC